MTLALGVWPMLGQGKEEKGQEQVSAKKKYFNTWGNEETFSKLLGWIEYNLGVLKGLEIFK